MLYSESFRRRYNVDAANKFAQYKIGECEVCGKETTQVDAALLYVDLPTYLCSEECYAKYWRVLII